MQARTLPTEYVGIRFAISWGHPIQINTVLRAHLQEQQHAWVVSYQGLTLFLLWSYQDPVAWGASNTLLRAHLQERRRVCHCRAADLQNHLCGDTLINLSDRAAQGAPPRSPSPCLGTQAFYLPEFTRIPYLGGHPIQCCRRTCKNSSMGAIAQQRVCKTTSVVMLSWSISRESPMP